MPDEPKVAEVPVEPPKPREPMTAPQAVAELNDWIERVKADGLNPYQLMAGLGLKQFTGLGERLLAAMDTAPAKKK